MHDTICGPDNSCATACPVKRFGRICPDFPTFLEEVRVLLAADVTPGQGEGEEVPPRAPQLV